jgi:hypothetical protein
MRYSGPMSKLFVPRFTLTAVLFALGSMAARSSEIDSFSQRYQPLRDATRIVEAQTRIFWDQALAEANDTRSGCNEDRLYKSLRKRFGNHLFGEMSKWLAKSRDLPARAVAPDNSIYRGLSLGESIVLSSFRKQGNGRVIRMGEHEIGADKFEHFWGSGFAYFRKGFLRREIPSIVPALLHGQKMEGGLFGATMTGVYSFGDLSANFNGMRFWNHVLGRYTDPLGSSQNLGPYVACREGRWTTLEYPRWSKYIDASWDEGINCSAFRTNSMKEKVEAHLDALAQETGERFRCPMTRKFNRQLWRKYGELSHQLLNHDGFRSLEENDFR